MNENKGGGAPRLLGLAAAAVAAGVCFFTYFKGGEEMYGAAFLTAAVCFAVMGAAEAFTVRKRMGGEKAGALSYVKPAFFLVLSALTLAAAVYFFLRR